MRISEQVLSKCIILINFIIKHIHISFFPEIFSKLSKDLFRFKLCIESYIHCVCVCLCVFVYTSRHTYPHLDQFFLLPFKKISRFLFM